MDANNVTADTFSHMSSTQRCNENAIFTSEKIDKSDDLEDTLKDFKTNHAKYYKSKSANTIHAKGNFIRNLKTVTHSSNRKVKS